MNAMLNALRKMFRPTSRPPAPRGVRLRLEVLEDRCVPSITQITNASTYPYSAVVRVESIFPDSPANTAQWGTGALIDGTHVLTAGHVLFDPSLGGWATQVYVFAGMTSQNRDIAEAQGAIGRTFNNFHDDVTSEWQNHGDTNHDPGDGDIGLITLTTNIGQQTDAFDIGYNDQNSFASATLNTIGYPARGDANSWDNGWNMWAQTGTIGGTTNFTQLEVGAAPFSSFYFSQSDIQMEGGQSGSPLFTYSGSGPAVIYGVMDVVGSSLGYAERITSTVFNALETSIQDDESGSSGSGNYQAKSLISAPKLLNTQTTLQASASSGSYGHSVTFTAYVSSAGSPTPTTGTVTFYDGGTKLGTVQVKAYSSTTAYASFTTSTLGVGSHSITAVYSGGGDFEGSTSAAVTERVTGGGKSDITLFGPGETATSGQALTFSALVEGAGAFPTGTVTFYDGGKVLGTAQLKVNVSFIAQAFFSTSALGVGSHTITAVYSGDGNYAGSTSNPQTAMVKPAQPDPVFGLFADHSLWERTAAGWQLLSPAGTILSISAVTDAAGQDDVYAVTSDHHLWEHSPGLPGNGWTMLSTNSFQQVIAATNLSGNAVVFAVLTDHSLWEQNPANGAGLNVGWTLLSPAGTILSISAVTDAARNDDVYAITVSGPNNLWEHTPAGWAFLSTASFQSVSAGLNGAGQAVVYGVLSGGSLWEQNPANGAGLNVGWRLLSPPGTILSASAGGPDQVFAATADQHLWQYTRASGWSLTSTGSFASISGQDNGGSGEVFAVLADGSLWEYTTDWAELDGNALIAAAAPRRG